jgi:hypothetical protein
MCRVGDGGRGGVGGWKWVREFGKEVGDVYCGYAGFGCCSSLGWVRSFLRVFDRSHLTA